MRPRRTSPTERPLWPALLVALALLVQGLVPAGAMAAPSADGPMTVQICTHEGLKTVTVGDHAPAPAAAMDCCDHCVMAVAAAVPMAATVQAVSYVVVQPAYRSGADAPRPRARAPPRPHSQGPPALV